MVLQEAESSATLYLMGGELLGPRIAAIYELQSAWLEPRLRALGLRWTTFQLLTAVAAAGGRAPQVEIAQRLGVTPATLSETVRSHLESGLLVQVAHPDDRRVRLLELTPRACEIMDYLRECIAEFDGLLVEGMSEQEVTDTVSALDKALGKLHSRLGRR